jgi:ABC-type Fe3+ transport system substrate-binding protein
MADSGAPLGIGFLEPVVSKAQVLLLARRAAHPRAAALFIDWALSKQGLSTPMKNYSAALSNVGGGSFKEIDLSISARLWPDGFNR